MASPATYENIQHIPLTVPINSRDGTLTTDAYSKNVFFGKDGDGEVIVVKRPGLKKIADVSALGLSSTFVQGAGFYGVANGLVAVIGNRYVYPAASPFSPYALAFPVNANCRMRVGFNNSDNAGYGVFAAQCYSPTLNFIQSGSNSVNTQGNQTVTTATLVPSLCELNSRWYVMTTAGLINSSATGNTSNWPALMNLQVECSIGTPSCMVKHLSYLVAFGTKGSVAYYDAGNSPGIAIQRVDNSISKIGLPITCRFAPVSVNDTLYFLGDGGTAGAELFAMRGLTAQSVTPPGVARLLTRYLNACEESSAYGLVGWAGNNDRMMPTLQPVMASGHKFLLLTFPSFAVVSPAASFSGITLAYCIDTGTWHWWTQVIGGVEGYVQLAPYTQTETIKFQNAAGSPNLPGPLVLGESDGNLYSWDIGTYQDNGQGIPVVIQTDSFSWGNQRVKLIPATYPSLDNVASTVYVSWSDDDYTTFTTPVAVSTANPKKQIIRCGSTIRRAWMLTHNDNTPMRFYDIEVEVVPGAL
jgi:hypothetical protein